MDPVFKPYRGVGRLLGGNSPQPPHPEEALLLNMGDNEADGVHVGGPHHPGARPLFMDNQVAQGVGDNLVGEGPGQLLDFLPDAPLIPGGAVGLVQGL